VAEQAANLIVALTAVGMALAFWSADPESPISRALALTLGLLGAAIFVHVLDALGLYPEYPHLWGRVEAIVEASAAAAGYDWILRTGRTNAATNPRAKIGEGLLRAAQAMVACYAVAAIAFPEAYDLAVRHGWRHGTLRGPTTYLFPIFFQGSLMLSTVRVFQLLLRDVDPTERIRLLALVVATPFFVSGIMLPSPWGAFSMEAGELIFLTGAIRYHVGQGQRGEFLARFLSPSVSRLVRERGLASTLQESRVQLSVVACDLRGFTSFSETAAPEDVFGLLGEYYETIGNIASEHGGTIKDLAGDGVLCLVGAPLPLEDHAPRAVSMALRMRERGGQVLGNWRRLGLDLGIGVGVASGFATVGVIESGGRLEYGAVGPAVNLASRLCDRAANGQVLVDQRTVGLIGDDAEGVSFRPLAEEDVKGFSKAVAIFEARPVDGAARLFRQTLPRLPRKLWRSLLAGVADKTEA
jgi:class 3 adenylate cyclase